MRPMVMRRGVRIRHATTPSRPRSTGSHWPSGGVRESLEGGSSVTKWPVPFFCGFKCRFIWVVFFPRFGSRRANFEAAARSLLAAPRACQCGVFLCVAQYAAWQSAACTLYITRHWGRPGGRWARLPSVRKGQYPESRTIHVGASDSWQVERRGAGDHSPPAVQPSVHCTPSRLALPA
jgi:hypothetical protein